MAIFTGSFRRNVDGKNRVLVPSELRDVMDPEDRRGLYIIPGKKCLFLWPQSYLLTYASGRGADPFGNLEFNRTFYSRAIFKSFDGTGRIVFPADLVERFPKREVLIAGTGLYLEVWDPARWDAEVGELDVE
ncbi:MAG: hypothetical protein O7E54_05185 [Planctomycetota bacterium]|nr:hypothetical protein [Planctomycetota bacterium]